MANFFKKAFQDMKESAKAQHEVDKAQLEAVKAESKAQWEEAKMTPAQRQQRCRRNARRKSPKRKPARPPPTNALKKQRNDRRKTGRGRFVLSPFLCGSARKTNGICNRRAFFIIFYKKFDKKGRSVLY